MRNESCQMFSLLNDNTKLFSQEYVFEYVVCKVLTIMDRPHCVDTLRPRQNVRHFPDDIFQCIFLNEMIMYEFRLKFH